MSVLKEAPQGSNVFDLDSERKARAEARAAAGEASPFIKLDAGYVELKPEIDALAAEDFTGGHIRAGLAKILADPTDVEEVVKGGFSRDDLQAVVKFLNGNSLGE